MTTDPEPGGPRRGVRAQQYMEATDRADAAAVAALLDDEVRFAMPPEPGTRVGRDVVVGAWVSGRFGSPSLGRFQTVCPHGPTRGGG